MTRSLKSRYRKILLTGTLAILGTMAPVYGDPPTQSEQVEVSAIQLRWTAETITQHPEDYLNVVERDTKLALQKLDSSEISINQRKLKLESQRDDLLEQLDFGTKDLAQLKTLYTAALTTHNFPVQWEEYELTQDIAQAQIIKLDNEITTSKQLLRQIRTNLTQLQAERDKLSAMRIQAKAQLAKLTVNRECLRIHGVTQELKESLLNIRGVNGLIENGPDSPKPLTIEELMNNRKKGIDPKKFQEAMDRK